MNSISSSDNSYVDLEHLGTSKLAVSMLVNVLIYSRIKILNN